jgi:hypothetical protein
MGQLPTWWYQTDMIWREYPHWDMQPELKRYYLMHAAYWCQQLLVMATGLEKPRKDFNELIAHHLVTLWMIGWSYLVNVTRFGNAVYLSMDVPDAFFAVCSAPCPCPRPHPLTSRSTGGEAAELHALRDLEDVRIRRLRAHMAVRALARAGRARR